MGTKPAWLYNQSAVIPFMVNNGVTEIVLVTSSSSENLVIPKGVIERFMSPEESAAKEALEEAGVVGKVIDQIIAEYEYEKWGGTCNVKVYPLEVTEVLEEWDEMNKRSRFIVEASKAAEIIKSEQRPAINKFLEWKNDSSV